VGDDFNAKHIHWGSRMINPKGRELFNTIQKLHLQTYLQGNQHIGHLTEEEFPSGLRHHKRHV